MNTKNDGGPAFPTPYTTRDGEAVSTEYEGGMTLRQYAAIQLRVPDSGTDWLDTMIERARRNEFAEKAMQGFCADPHTAGTKPQQFAEAAYVVADAMLAARGAA